MRANLRSVTFEADQSDVLLLVETLGNSMSPPSGGALDVCHHPVVSYQVLFDF